MRVPPTIADRMSAPANPRLLVSRIEMILAVMGDEWMRQSCALTDEDRAKITGPGLHNV
jgi:hypothetical protein